MMNRVVGGLMAAYVGLPVLAVVVTNATAAETGGNESAPVEAIVDKALAHFSKGETEAGRSAVAQAVELSADLAIGRRARTLMDAGKRLCDRGCFREGAGLFRRAALAFGTYRDEVERAGALASLGETYMAHGDYELALAAYPLAIEAIESPRAVEMQDSRANAQNPVQPGRPTRIPQVRYQRVGNTTIPRITYIEIPGVMRRLYSVKDNPLKAFYASNRQRFAGECRRRMTEAYAELGQFDQASQEAAKAAAVYKKLNDPFERARSLLMLAAMERLVGQYDTAEQNLAEALKLFRGVRLQQGEDIAAGEIQTLAQLFAFPHRELPPQQNLAVKNEMKMVAGERGGENSNEKSKHEKPEDKGADKDKPDDSVRKAFRSLTGMDAFWTSTQARIDTITTYRSRKDRSQYYVVRFVRPIDPWQGEADVHAEWAALTIARENYARAFDFANRATQLHRAIGDDGALIDDLSLTSLAALRSGKTQEAKRLADEQLALAEQAGRTELVWKAQLNLARCLRQDGQLEAARRLLMQASEAVEQLRAAASREAFRIGVFERRVTVYDELLSLLFELDESDVSSPRKIEALETAEKARARVLLEAMLGVRGKSEIQSRPRERLLADRRRVQQQIGQFERELRTLSRDSEQAGEDEAARLNEQLAQLRTKLADTGKKLLAVFEAPQRRRFVKPATYDELRAADSIPAGTAILAYWLGSDRSFLWVLDGDSVHTAVLPPRKEIQRAADSVVEQLVGYPTSPRDYPIERFDRISYELYQMVVAPAIRWLPDVDRLIIVPDGRLHSVPFGALAVRATDNSAGGRPRLIDRFSIATAPSVSVFHRLAQRAQERSFLANKVAVFADPVIEESGEAGEEVAGLGRPYFPPLPMTRKVADQLLGIFGDNSDVFLAEAATESAAKRCLTQDYRFVYFGTHGLLDMQAPDYSGLLLAADTSQGDDGFLRLNELAALDIKTPLVTLAACETGLGKHRRGEGVMAFQRELLAAGAENVVVSLWKVADASSAAVMKNFYSNLAGDHRNVAGALRAAQLALRDYSEQRFDPQAAAEAIGRGEQPEKITVRPYEHPFHWAAFVVAGAGS